MAEPDWLRDWGVIWRSELRALAGDRELREAEDALGDALRRARSAPATRTAAAPVPPDAGGTADLVVRLARRVDELEQRLARLDTAGGA